MPSFVKKQPTALAHRPNPLKGKLAKAHDRIAKLSKRARAGLVEQEEAAIAVGAPLLLGVAEARGISLPTVMNLDPALLWGAGAAILGLKVVKGKNGKRLLAVGVGLLGSAARDSARRGSVRMGEDEVGADEVGADDDDNTL